MIAVVVTAAAALGWTVPANSPLWWITVVAVGLAILFGISGFQAYRELHRPFPRIAVATGMIIYDSVKHRVEIPELHITNRETRRNVSLSFGLETWRDENGVLTQVRTYRDKRESLRDPLTITSESGEAGGLVFNVHGDVGNDPSLVYVLTILDRITGKSMSITVPGAHPADEETLYGLR